MRISHNRHHTSIYDIAFLKEISRFKIEKKILPVYKYMNMVYIILYYVPLSNFTLYMNVQRKLHNREWKWCRARSAAAQIKTVQILPWPQCPCLLETNTFDPRLYFHQQPTRDKANLMKNLCNAASSLLAALQKKSKSVMGKVRAKEVIAPAYLSRLSLRPNPAE